MSKRQKLSDPGIQFEDLPDEVILKILGYLEGSKGLIYCGHLSMRIRTISQDETLWQKINLSRQNIPTGFLEMVLNNGCKYLNLRSSYFNNIDRSVKLNRPNQLQYLDLPFTSSTTGEVIGELLGSCCSLQKLSVYLFNISLVNRISPQNWKSLKVLNFEGGFDMESIKLVVKNCIELRELTIIKTDLSEDIINLLVNNLTPKIQKLNLSCIGYFSAYSVCVKDEQIKTLVERCNKITSLNLQNSEITNKSITSIVENLQVSLEELGISHYKNVSYNKLLELKLMPKLRVLKYFDAWYHPEFEMNLKKDMPHLIFLRSAEIAENRSNNGIWEIKANKFQLNRSSNQD